MNRSLPAVGLGLLLLAAGCFDDLAGNSTETENSVAARTIRVDSILPAWNRPADVATVASLRLDASTFDFSHADSAGERITVERLDGTPIPFEIVYWDSAGSSALLRVRIDTALLAQGSQIVLRWDRKPASRTDSAAVWSAIPDSQRLELTSVLVDDFERGTLVSYLPDSTAWYTSVSEDATVSKPALTAAGRNRPGNALHITYNAPAATYRYSLVGIALGKQPVSLRRLDSLVIRVRGTGKLGIAFDRLHLDSTRAGKAWTHHMLDTTWTRIRIRPQDLDSANGLGGNKGWDFVRDSITNLTFLVSGGSDLWLDDVRLHGIDRDDLR